MQAASEWLQHVCSTMPPHRELGGVMYSNSSLGCPAWQKLKGVVTTDPFEGEQGQGLSNLSSGCDWNGSSHLIRSVICHFWTCLLPEFVTQFIVVCVASVPSCGQVPTVERCRRYPLAKKWLA
jgi:hypothetical protein